jgi:hypothetical protein
LIGAFGSFETYTDQKSCILTQSLYYGTSYFSGKLRGIVERFLNSSRVGELYLQCLYEVTVAFPAEEALNAILAESYEALLGLSGSEDTALSTMAVQLLDVLAITDN